jgi:type II secretory pathway pseudopilin PulG
MKRAKGFTTIELVVIIVIMGILATIAIPGFSRWLPNYRLRAAARDMFSNFQHAKLTAVKRHQTCAITFNQDIGGTVYDYVVYVDTISNLVFDDPGDEVLTTVLFSERYKGVIFDTTEGGGDGVDFIDNANSCPTLGFLSNGFTIDSGGNPVSGSVFLINPNGRERAVAVSAAGNITIIE